MKHFFILILTLSLVSSCVEEEPDVEVTGPRPIYVEGEASELIASEAPKNFGTLGKFVYASKFIYVNEVNKGIHVIDNSDPTDPTSKHYWNVPGLIDFTVNGTLVYAEQGRDLLVIDVSNPEQLEVCNILRNVFEDLGQNQFPTDHVGPFECVDPSKGLVVGWEPALLVNPKCSI